MPDRALLAELALARGSYDRASVRRDDQAWLAAAWDEQVPARLLLLRDGQAPVDDEGLVLASPRAFAATPGVRLLLGVDEGVAYLGLIVPEDGVPPEPSAASEASEPQVVELALDGQDRPPVREPDRLPDGVRWATLREIGAGLGPRDAGLLVTTVALANWHNAYPRCPRCGTATEVSTAGWARRCPVDHSEHFPRHDAAVIVLVRDRDGRALLGRRAGWEQGWYSTLAGFVEAGESAEMTVQREMAEEAGVRIDPDRVDYLGSQPWPFPSSLMIGCHAEALTTEIHRDDVELEDCRWFGRAEIRSMIEGTHPEGFKTPPSIAIASHIIRAWVEAG